MHSSFYQVQVSSELRAVFDELRDLTDLADVSESIASNVADSSKYASSTLHALSRMILFRSHGRHMRWLCVLVVAAIRADHGRGFATFLWGGKVGSRDHCAAYFLNALPQHGATDGITVTASTDAVTIHFAGTGRSVLTLEYKFMPLLACLLDFMIRTIGFDRLSDLQERLAGDGFAQSDLDDAANALTRELYAWLDPHVTSKHEQSLFRVVGDFFAHRLGDSFALQDIDDSSIFDLWVFMTSPESSSKIAKPPKKFSSTYLACLRFMDLLSDSDDFRKLDAALTIVPSIGDNEIRGDRITADALPTTMSGPAVEDEEVAISDIRIAGAAVSAVYARPDLDEPENLLLALSESSINAINDGFFVKTLPLVCSWPQWIERLPLSYLRSEVFGSIVKVGGASWENLFQKNAYEDAEHRIKNLETQIDDALSAVLFLRIRKEGQSDDSERAEFALARGNAVLRKTRRGFQEALRGDPDSVGAFLSLEEPLIFCKTCVGRTRNAMSQVPLSMEYFEQDRHSFAQQIELICGGRP